MSLRLTHKSNHFSLINVMKSTLQSLILAHLVLNLVLTGVKASSEVLSNTAEESLNPRINSDNENTKTVNLEKRAAPHQYNFGIGKKSYNLDVFDDEAGHDVESDVEEPEIKRADQNRFAFGLGKRANTEQRFAFGLGKKSDRDRNRFQFGLGKRAIKDNNRFAFGLGKREHDVEEYIKRRYSFGLGKRSAQYSLPNNHISDGR